MMEQEKKKEMLLFPIMEVREADRPLQTEEPQSKGQSEKSCPSSLCISNTI